jgi:hypothetical protein
VQKTHQLDSDICPRISTNKKGALFSFLSSSFYRQQILSSTTTTTIIRRPFETLPGLPLPDRWMDNKLTICFCFLLWFFLNEKGVD